MKKQTSFWIINNIMRSYEELIHMLKGYGEALIELENYTKIYYRESDFNKPYYKDRAALVEIYGKYFQNVAKEFVIENKEKNELK